MEMIGRSISLSLSLNVCVWALNYFTGQDERQFTHTRSQMLNEITPSAIDTSQWYGWIRFVWCFLPFKMIFFIHFHSPSSSSSSLLSDYKNQHKWNCWFFIEKAEILAQTHTDVAAIRTLFEGEKQDLIICRRHITIKYSTLMHGIKWRSKMKTLNTFITCCQVEASNECEWWMDVLTNEKKSGTICV